MKRQLNRNQERLARQRALLVALSDDLALPLIQVKSAVEIAASNNFEFASTVEQARNIALSADSGLQLVEAYRMLLRSEEIINTPFEPVAIGAIMENIAHRLTPYARQYDTKIEVDIQGRFAPVLVHEASLAMALEVLSASLIRAQVAQIKSDKYRIVLGAHRAGEGLAAGVFSDVQGISDKSLRAARGIMGDARQPLPSVPPGTASGILIADMLCSSLWQPLRRAAHRSLGGLATSLPVSKQLQLM